METSVLWGVNFSNEINIRLGKKKPPFKHQISHYTIPSSTRSSTFQNEFPVEINLLGFLFYTSIEIMISFNENQVFKLSLGYADLPSMGGDAYATNTNFCQYGTYPIPYFCNKLPTFRLDDRIEDWWKTKNPK